MTTPDGPSSPSLRDADVELVPVTGQVGGADERDPSVAAAFTVCHRGEAVGRVGVRVVDGTAAGVGQLSWLVEPAHRGLGVGRRAVRLLIRHAFDDLELSRVEAHLDPDDIGSRRTASRSGLRQEGVLRHRSRGEGDQRRDQVLVARLATDPDPLSREGFLGVLNAGLPRKRVISQGLIRNRRGQVLLCELVYKKEWDLPGGVVDPYESPALALGREIAEELRVDVHPERVLGVNWLPPYRGWEDAVLFVFDLGVDDDIAERAVLEQREIRALHWCDLDDVESYAASYVTRMLRRLARQRPAAHRGEGTAYLEDGTDPT